MEFPGLLFVISGPSGVGKGTLVKKLAQSQDNLKVSVSMTTRQPRPGEIDGQDYIFCDKDFFMAKVAADDFVEWAEVYRNYYGTPWEEIQSALKKGRDIILEIDTQGALQVKQKYPQGILIYVLPPCREELKARITGRGTESPEAVERRLASLENELKTIEEYDYLVINDSLEVALDKLKAIYTAEKCRTHRNLTVLNNYHFGEDE